MGLSCHAGEEAGSLLAYQDTDHHLIDGGTLADEVGLSGYEALFLDSSSLFSMIYLNSSKSKDCLLRSSSWPFMSSSTSSISA
jgi:hypothetical protein